MYKWKKVLALIPARKWSKWIINKNIKILWGKPLLEHSVGHCLNSKHIDDTYVSSDWDDILDLAKGLWVWAIRRPDKLSDDKAKTQDAVKHAILELKDSYDLIVLIQPTNPLRDKWTIDKAIEVFVDNFDKYDSLMPVSPSKAKRWVIEDGFYKPYNEWETPRQLLQEEYEECWAVFIYKKENVWNQNIIWKNILPFIILSKIESIDIDTEDDFFIAQSILSNTNYGS